MTYVPLAQITLTAPDAEIVFGNIPNSFRDLVLVMNGTMTANSFIGLRFNGDSANSYSGVRMYSGSGSPGYYSNTNSGTFAWLADFVTVQGMITANVMDYTATDKRKTVLARNNLPTYDSGVTQAIASTWANTSAVTSMTVVGEAGKSFASGTTLALYGIAG